MKICLVNGSPRKNGATAKILHYMQSYLGQKDGLELQYVDLSDYQITLCKGCVNCYKTGECFIKNDGVEALARQVKSADGIIIGTPTFGSDITSYLNAFFDRGHFIVEQSLAHKYGFSIVT
ncbi:MAG TPA: flavodoxin family protein, partial [Bacillota bacterium]|nr:flavodoxin family protein [Bacillota bacterium]